MSHFFVIVAVEHPDQLEPALQPFHEYECTGIMDQYVTFIDCSEKIQNEWDNETQIKKTYRAPDGTIYGGYESLFYQDPIAEEAFNTSELQTTTRVWIIPKDFEQITHSVQDIYLNIEAYAKDYHGYTTNSAGAIGHYTNPNAKWDWWVEGGRWENSLRHINGNNVDRLLRSELDLKTPMQEAAQEASLLYDKMHKAVGNLTWDSWKNICEVHKDIEIAQKIYQDQDAIIILKEELKKEIFPDYDSFLLSRENYIDKISFSRIASFAIVYKGDWIERGDMGWWGITTNEKSDWNQEWLKIMADIPGHFTLIGVDCHI